MLRVTMRAESARLPHIVRLASTGFPRPHCPERRRRMHAHRRGGEKEARRRSHTPPFTDLVIEKKYPSAARWL